MCVDDKSWLAELGMEAERARHAGVTDKRLAYALHAVRAGFPFEPELAEYGDLIWKLAWLLNVRAPGLDLRWLIKGVLVVDRLYWEDLSLDHLLQILVDLEQLATDAYGELHAWLAETPVDPGIDPIRIAASRREEIAALSGSKLSEQVKDAMAEVNRCVQEGDLLALVADDLPRG